MTYRWEPCPNPDYSVLHVSAVLPAVHVHEWGLSDHDAEKLDEEDAAFVREVFDVPGVTSFSMTKYRCSVTRSPIYPWEPIRQQVLAVVKARYAPHAALIRA